MFIKNIMRVIKVKIFRLFVFSFMLGSLGGLVLVDTATNTFDVPWFFYSIGILIVFLYANNDVNILLSNIHKLEELLTPLEPEVIDDG